MRIVADNIVLDSGVQMTSFKTRVSTSGVSTQATSIVKEVLG